MKTSGSLRLARTMQRLSLDAPRVIGARMAMLSDAGGSPGARDLAEISRMVLEKQSAAADAWLALWGDGMRQYQTSVVRFWTAFLTGDGNGILRSNIPSTRASLASANRMLRPYQRRASANAHRLSKKT